MLCDILRELHHFLQNITQGQRNRNVTAELPGPDVTSCPITISCCAAVDTLGAVARGMQNCLHNEKNLRDKVTQNKVEQKIVGPKTN